MFPPSSQSCRPSSFLSFFAWFPLSFSLSSQLSFSSSSWLSFLSSSRLSSSSSSCTSSYPCISSSSRPASSSSRPSFALFPLCHRCFPLLCIALLVLTLLLCISPILHVSPVLLTPPPLCRFALCRVVSPRLSSSFCLFSVSFDPFSTSFDPSSHRRSLASSSCSSSHHYVIRIVFVDLPVVAVHLQVLRSSRRCGGNDVGGRHCVGFNMSVVVGEKVKREKQATTFVVTRF